MTIKEIMAGLSMTDKEQLMTAFEASMTHYIEWTPGRFIGVNTDSVPHLTCCQQSGSFREGTINVLRV